MITARTDSGSAERADRFEALARRRSLRMINSVVAGALIIALCMWAFIIWSLWSEYSAARNAGRTEGYNLSAAFASELTMTLDMIDTAFRVIDDEVEHVPVSATDLTDLRAEIAAAAGPESDVRIVAPDGHLLLAALPSGAMPNDYGRESHFIAHRDQPSLDLSIDPLAPGTGTGIELSRRLETADRHFAGEVLLLLKPQSLVTLNRVIDVGQRGMVTIVGSDGRVRAGFDRTHPDGLAGIGIDLRSGPYPADLPPGRVTAYERESLIDGVARLVTIRSLERYPLRVIVGLDTRDVLGPARHHIWLIGLAGLGATLLVAMLTVLLSRELWRRTEREIELAYDRNRLISAQRRIEADHARLDEANRELLISRDRAEAASRARSQFLAHMSHELRTPLHAIIGFSELIRDQAPRQPGTLAIASYAADIWSSGRHLLDLINTILEISKVESGAKSLSESVFSAGDLARESRASALASAEARGIAIELQLPETTMWIWADRARLLQVLANLLSNAVKFTAEGGRVTLAVSTSAAGEPVFSVIDRGIGMNEAEIAIALEPFGQVDNRLARCFEGPGLGLPLAHKLTELHGGRLDLTSAKGEGTTVNVVLPPQRLRPDDGHEL